MVSEYDPQAFLESQSRFVEVYARGVAAHEFGLAVLKLPKPDIFLGRKTHEPFPREDGNA
ncbi:hypothetical protein [Bradyrhizobium sp. CCGB01]|uniref:hypothetical protein n=1 Tax=Bradyrhizobium sp. CCGB01 TaxID=2949634 RepID=UPI0020B1F830|nr:hypothetical protein [Bradyrhizobium sp. CCGB01]MCP3410040.1 hypothetical protein [Bradyrhizobium sp. CCGB01]